MRQLEARSTSFLDVHTWDIQMGSELTPLIKMLGTVATSKIRTLMYRTHFQMLSHASQRVLRNLSDYKQWQNETGAALYPLSMPGCQGFRLPRTAFSKGLQGF